MKQLFDLDRLLELNVKISSVKKDYGFGIWTMFILTPFVLAIMGFFTDWYTLYSIGTTATDWSIISGFIGLVVAVLIQLFIFSTPTGVGKNLRFALKAFMLGGMVKRAFKSLFFAVLFGVISYAALSTSLFINSHADSIIDAKLISNLEADTTANDGAYELSQQMIKDKAANEKSALATKTNATNAAAKVYEDAINANPAAYKLFIDIEKSKAKNLNHFAAKLQKKMVALIPTQTADYNKALKGANDSYNETIGNVGLSFTAGIAGSVGNQQKIIELKEKAVKLLKFVLKQLLRYANIFVFILSFVFGFISKDIKENEENEIDLTTIDSQMLKSKK